MPSKNAQAFRCAVVAVFQDDGGKVLVCERADQEGVWLLPQGGVEQGESGPTALRRQMRQEIGTDLFDIVRIAPSETRYVYPQPGRYHGQALKWYLLRFRPGVGPASAAASAGIQSFRWLSPDEVLALANPWKRAAYSDGLTELGLVGAKFNA